MMAVRWWSLLAALSIFSLCATAQTATAVTCEKLPPAEAVLDLKAKMRRNYPPDLGPLFEAAEASLRKGQVDAAIAPVKFLVVEQAERLELIVPYADLLLRAHRYLDAIAQFQQALLVEKDPTYAAHLYSQLALAQRGAGRVKDAITSYERAKQLSGGNVRYAMFLAIELEDAGQQERAVAEYERILECDPSDPTALSGLAQNLALLGFDLERAAEYAERAYRTFPAPRFGLVLGSVYLRQGRAAEAFRVLRSAYLDGPTNSGPSYRVQLAQALREMDARQPQDEELGELLLWEFTPENDRRIRQLLSAK